MMQNIIIEAPDIVLELVKKYFAEMYKTTKTTQIEFLNVSENYTFLVRMGKAKRILRVHRPYYHTPDELNSENIWMKRLKKDTELILPKIVCGLDGKMIQRFYSDNKNITYSCSMFTYLEGTLATELNLTGNELLKKMVSMGKIAAILHNYVVANEMKIHRNQWNFDSMFGEKAIWGDWRNCKELKVQDVQLFEKALSIMEKRLADFGKGFDRYGLIHCDLRFANTIIDGNKLQIIDFDDCGYSWFLYDLACCMLEYNDQIDELVSAWLTGYRGIRALSEEEIAEIPTFILMRRILRFAWFSTHRDTQTAKTIDIPKYLEKTIELSEKYLNDNKEALLWEDLTVKSLS